MSSSGNNSKPSTSTGVRPRNQLDSTAPTPRGKERRNPKEKKPKAFRKQLNKERNLLKLTMSDKAVVYRDADSILIVGKNDSIPHCSKGIIIGKSDNISHYTKGLIIGKNDSIPHCSKGIIIGKNDSIPHCSTGIIIGKNDSIPHCSTGIIIGKNDSIPHCSKGIIIGRSDSISHSSKGIIIGKRESVSRSSQGSVTIGKNDGVPSSSKASVCYVGKNDGVPSTSKASVCYIGKDDRVPNTSKASVCFISKNDRVPNSSKASLCIIGKNDFIAHSSHSSVTTPDEIEPGAARVPLIASIDPVINYEDVLSKRLSEIGLIDNVEALVHYTLHSSRHREYARQALTNEIEYSTYLILINLVRYQDRIFNKAPEKIETKRRYVCGFNQVNKYIRNNKVKAVIIAPDIEQIIVDGVLDEAVENLISTCQEREIPTIFTSTRNRLARVCSKTPRSHLSCLGIIDYSGVHDEFNKLVHFVEKARETYDKTQAMLVRYLENLPPSAFTEFYTHIREKNNLPCELQSYRQAIHTPLKRSVYSYIRLIKHSKPV